MIEMSTGELPRADEQKELLQVLARFVSTEAPVGQFRALRDRGESAAYSIDLWQALCELGLAQSCIAETDGGLGFGLGTAMLIMREFGRQLVATPFLASGVLIPAALQGVTLLSRQSLLAGLQSGRLRAGLNLGFAGNRPRLSGAGSDWTLNGVAEHVVDGIDAQHWLIRSDCGGRSSWVMVDAGAVQRATVRTQVLIDHRNLAAVTFDRTRVPAENIIARDEEAESLTQHLEAAGALASAAELLGIAEEVYRRGIEYLGQRKQFGVPIGSFQALKHRAARLFCSLQVAIATLETIAAEVERSQDRALELSSLAKATLARVAVEVVSEVMQFHGGIAMTDEFDLGLYFKRCHVLARQFGSRTEHEARLGALWGL